MTDCQHLALQYLQGQSVRTTAGRRQTRHAFVHETTPETADQMMEATMAPINPKL